MKKILNIFESKHHKKAPFIHSTHTLTLTQYVNKESERNKQRTSNMNE